MNSLSVPLGLDSPGYDLMALLTGSEGLLGVVTEVTVRLLPLPETARVIVAGFDSVAAAGDAVGAVLAAGIIPAGLEMMDALAIQAAEDFCHAGYPRDAAAILLCEVDGVAAEVAQYAQMIDDLFRTCGATSLTQSSNESERALLWKGRKSAFPAVGRLAPDYYCMDGTIPRSRIAAVLDDIARLARQFDLSVANVFHAGDGNLHPLILFDSGDPLQTLRAEALGGDDPRDLRCAPAAASPASTASAWRSCARCPRSSAARGTGAVRGHQARLRSRPEPQSRQRRTYPATLPGVPGPARHHPTCA
jgi:glycolate oxidase